MIYDKLENCELYAGISPYFAKAFAFMKANDLASLPLGRHEIDGDNAYLMVQEKNPLSDWDKGVWEGHRKYADIQLVVDGEEILGVRSIQDLPISQEYNEEKDFLLFQQEAEGIQLPLEKGDFAILFPQDAHRPGVRKPGGRTSSRRIVVKVRV